MNGQESKGSHILGIKRGIQLLIQEKVRKLLQNTSHASSFKPTPDTIHEGILEQQI